MKKNIESNYCGYVELELKKKSLVESYI